VDTLCEKMLNCAMPSSYRFLLWSASENTSLFDSQFEKKKPKKNQKYLIYEEKKKIEQGLNDVWSVIEPEDWKRKILMMMQPNIIKSKENIKKKVFEFLKAKNELLLEINKMSNIVHNEVFPKFWPQDIARTELWIHSKKHEKELSVSSLFDIKQPDLLIGDIGGVVQVSKDSKSN